jgi:hypothetical protein
MDHRRAAQREAEGRHDSGMTSASDIASAVFGTIAAAFVIWCIVRLVNDRRLPQVAAPAAVVGACHWLPFSWLILMRGHRFADQSSNQRVRVRRVLLLNRDLVVQPLRWNRHLPGAATPRMIRPFRS